MQLDNQVLKQIDEWSKAPYDEETQKEIQALKKAESWKELNDRFYRELEFGTGGMRGVMGAGINRMNKYTVGKATQGLAVYLKSLGLNKQGVVIAYDSRNNSPFFAETAASVLAGNGIQVYLAQKAYPTPFLSFAVRQLGAGAGIVITASHNPSEYNGYKVFFSDGGQVLSPHDKNIIKEVQGIQNVSEINFASDDEKKQYITTLPEKLEADYLDAVEDCLDKKSIAENSKDLKVVYTSLHGTGRDLTRALLKDRLNINLEMVKEQESLDGNFPTVDSPNPEEPKALAMAIEQAKKIEADLVFGTDPDADRLGAVIRDKNEYVLMNGNQIGTVLMDYLLSNRSWGEKAYLTSTIVSSDIIYPIAKKYGMETEITLTGFKYIGEVITRRKGEPFIFGYEESFGFLIGDYIRDKDGISAAALVCEVAGYLKSKGKTMMDALKDIYCEYGAYLESLKSFTLKGQEGAEKISEVMEFFRSQTSEELFGMKVNKLMDLKTRKKFEAGKWDPYEAFPESNVLVFYLAPHYKVAVRPSGTEPKIKFYFALNGVSGENLNEKLKKDLAEFENRIMEGVKSLL